MAQIDYHLHVLFEHCKQVCTTDGVLSPCYKIKSYEERGLAERVRHRLANLEEQPNWLYTLRSAG